MEALKQDGGIIKYFTDAICNPMLNSEQIADAYWNCSKNRAVIDDVSWRRIEAQARFRTSQTGARIAIIDAVKEFYALEIISAVSKVNEMRHSHAKWQEDFSAFKADYTERFAAAIYDYTALVVAGEMRHANARACCKIQGFSEGGDRDGVMREALVYTSESILRAGAEIFDDQYSWESGYGGEKWQVIAKAGLLYGRFAHEVFIDHCVDLSHNNSVYFDKGAGIFRLTDTDAYNAFLDIKRNGSVMDVCNSVRNVGPRLFNLIIRARNLGIIKAALFSYTVPYGQSAEMFVMQRIPIAWGDHEVSMVIEKSDEYDSDNDEPRDDREREDDEDE